jgi:hypothetical protein
MSRGTPTTRATTEVAADVLALIKKVSRFPSRSEPLRFSSPTSTRQHGRAGGRNGPTPRVEGNEVAVSRFAGDKIAEVWLWYDGYDQAATTSSSRSTSARPSSPYPTFDGRSPTHSPRGIEDPPTSELRSGTDSPFVRLAIRQHDCMSS